MVVLDSAAADAALAWGGSGQQSQAGSQHFPFTTLKRSVSYRSTRTSLFDGIEEGGLRATSYSSHEIDEQENDRAIDGLQDHVSILKRLSGDIHEEVETHNRILNRMGNDMVHQGVFSLELWTNSRWCSRPNQVGGWEPWSHHLLLFFCWCTT